MKKTCRKSLCLMLAMVLMLAISSAVAEPSSLTDGVFDYTMTPEGREPMYNFVHFYDSNVFYASTYGGGQYAVGFYEVTDEPRDYEDGDGSTHAASKTILMKKLDGSEYATVAYDAEKGIIGDFTPLYNNELMHNLEPDADKIKENGVALYEYIVEGDDYAMVGINHNGTYQDSVDAIIEGTWTLDGNIYTLTDGDAGDVYTLTLSEDGYAAEYKMPDGTTYSMLLVREPEAVMVFTGTAKSATLGEVAAAIHCYDSGEAVLDMTVSGSTQSVPGGTWKLSDTKTSVAINVRGTDYEAAINMADYSFSFDLVMDVNGESMTFPMSNAVAATVVYTFVGENNMAIRLDCYSDGACELVYEGLGVVTSGTWNADSSAGPLPAWTIVLSETFENAPITVETDYATKFSFAFKNASGKLEDTLALSFTDYKAAN